MIDLHCHLLPGVDDGAPDLATAIELVEMAVADGIQHIVLTPHVHPGRYENTASSLQPCFSQFRSDLAERELPVSIAIAGEVRLGVEVLQMAAQDELPFIGQWHDKRVMLLELPHSHIPPGSDNLVKWLLDRGILPMIAHPERNKDIMHNLDKIRPFVDLGCLFQITAMSVTGEFGGVAHERAHDIISEGWATIVATDAHNRQHRPPILSRSRHMVQSLYGDEMVDRLFVSNPSRIVAA